MGLCDVQSVECEGETVVAIDSRAPLFPHIPALLFAMHLVYEVNKEKCTTGARESRVILYLITFAGVEARQVRCG